MGRQSPAIQDLHSYSRQGQFLHSRIELNIPFYQQDKNKSRKMELYLKAGADGLTVGDCPFAHYVRALLAYKGLSCTVHPCPPSGKPSWLVEQHGGKMPCLRINDNVITEEVKGEVGGFFPAMA